MDPWLRGESVVSRAVEAKLSLHFLQWTACGCLWMAGTGAAGKLATCPDARTAAPPRALGGHGLHREKRDRQWAAHQAAAARPLLAAPLPRCLCRRRAGARPRPPLYGRNSCCRRARPSAAARLATSMASTSSGLIIRWRWWFRPSQETRLRVRLILAGVRRPRSQYVVCDGSGRFLARVDPCLAGTADRRRVRRRVARGRNTAAPRSSSVESAGRRGLDRFLQIRRFDVARQSWR